MDAWGLLLELILALTAALGLGILFEKLKLGAVVGYLIAGVGVGAATRGFLGVQATPSNLAQAQGALPMLAELGISILLFTTGLEFSLMRLRKLGRSTFLAGISQVLVNLIVFAGIATAFDLPIKTAIAVGAICAVSSTAIVVPSLRDRGDLDSTHGKVSFGTLLIQDMLMIPLVILITVLGGPSSAATKSAPIGITILAVVVFMVVMTRVIPRIFRAKTVVGNRDLPILLAIITCIASAWGAHAVGLSPSLGAFLAGMLLAETSFEHQIRSDMSGLKALFVTLFFLTIGMLIDVTWVAANWQKVSLAVLILLIGKVAANFLAIRFWKPSTISSFAASINLAHIGELGFVLLTVATAVKLLPPDQAQLLTVVGVLTMITASPAVANATKIARFLAVRLVPTKRLAVENLEERSESFSHHFVVFGFGTAGRTAVRILGEARYPVVAVDLNPKFAKEARDLGAVAMIGDATQIDLLEELHLADAKAAIVAIPDARIATHLIGLCRRLYPDLPIVARCRVHQFREELTNAGATLVIGEEELLGRRLGEESVRVVLGHDDDEVREAP